ncbi:MAG: DUF2235 domain-containing protein [Litorimonas sp.]
MAKNIVICLDGTGNEIEENISNVLKLYRSLRKNHAQRTYYSQGVGTLVRVRVWSRVRQALVDKLLGKMTGFGLDDRVVDAYGFIVEHYEPGDRIYIFGYSRGAYTARVLAGMIHAVGLLRPDQGNLVGAAYAAYLSEPGYADMPSRENANSVRFSVRDVEKEESKARTFRRVVQPRTVPVHFLGLFDTVGSVFAPSFGKKTLRPFTKDAYPHTFLNPSVRQVLHAVSIDERRQMFPVSLWPNEQVFQSNPYDPDPVAQSLEEVWFAGGHGDIGGGNPRPDSGLSQIPLIWMARNARRSGLKLHDRTFRYVSGQQPYSSTTRYLYPAPDPAAKLHRASWWQWFYFEIDLFRSRKVKRTAKDRRFWHFPLFQARPIPEGVSLHGSVVERMSLLESYRPPNLPKDYTVVETPDAP